MNSPVSIESIESVTASVMMTSPVRTITPTATIAEAQCLLLRYGHSGLCVVAGDRKLIGIITRRDIETALRHGFEQQAVSGFMSQDVKSVTPTTAITEIHHLMATYDIGRVPIIESNQLVGIITRTDLLRYAASQPKTNTPETAKGTPSQETPQPYLFQQNDDLRAREQLPPAPSETDLSSLTPPSSTTLCQKLAEHIPEAWPVLMQLAEVAEQRGWTLYIVGGAVRDLLIDLIAPKVATSNTGKQKAVEEATTITLHDIDLVVEGAGEGAGIELAHAIQTHYPQVSTQVYGQFQTASLTWKTTAENSPLSLDIATARTEFYPYPAANPEVEASSIHQDLYRRDFTINAMAICLSHAPRLGDTSIGASRLQPGQLIDFFGGWLDLQKRQVKVLHNNSFIEDPTRIFRAVRFATRLGFIIEPETNRFIQYAINSGIYNKMRASGEKIPALQSRLSAELQYLLSEPTWEAALTQASQIGALSCIHSDIKITPVIQRQLRRMSRWLTKLESKAFANKFGIESLPKQPPTWLMLLELILAQLDTSLREQVAIQLNLGAPSQQRLKQLHSWEADITQHMPKAKRSSQLFALLRSYKRPELLLLGARHPHTLGPQIWQYIVQLSDKPSIITGQNLKQMGYQPGPLFRKILTDVNNLALDGELTSVQEAEAYVVAQYSNPSS
ncbi:MAG: CBS domain-containing protein [Phormidesmis sp.]